MESILIGGLVVAAVVTVSLMLMVASIIIIESLETTARYARRWLSQRMRGFLAVGREGRVAP